MAVQSPPFALQNALHSAALFRQAASSNMLGGGVLGGGELAVAAQGTPNMSVSVAAGRAWITGTQAAAPAGMAFTTQAAYFALNDAPATVTVATADATNPRIDVAYIAVQDSAYSGSNNATVLGVVTGVPAPSPVAAAVPNNAIALANIAVAANATSIVSGNITDRRTGSFTIPQAYVCTSTTRPTGVFTGFQIYETDTGLCKIWSGGTWVTGVATPPAVIAYAANASAEATSGTAEQVFTGSEAVGGVGLVTGRAYSAEWEGRLSLTGGAGLAQALVRAARNAVPTTSSTVVGSGLEYVAGVGGPFQIDAVTGRRPFQVGTAGTWHFNLTGAVSAGAATVMTALADARGVHSITVYDLGPAPAGLRSI